jgi:hypothetical protein
MMMVLVGVTAAGEDEDEEPPPPQAVTNVEAVSITAIERRYFIRQSLTVSRKFFDNLCLLFQNNDK